MFSWIARAASWSGPVPADFGPSDRCGSISRAWQSLAQTFGRRRRNRVDALNEHLLADIGLGARVLRGQ
jgi:uncharacterized protein YjiS (DUF1127 family)